MLPAFLFSENSFLQYLNKIQEFPLLSFQQEEFLAKDWHENRNITSAHKLVTSHLRLVVKIAVVFKNYGLALMDLIMEGNIGLMHAVKKFNPNLGFRLSTYAVWWIKAAIKDYVIKSWSIVKIGTTQAQKKLFFGLKKSLKKLKNNIAKYDQNDLNEEEARIIAGKYSVSTKEVFEMKKRLSYRDKSLNDQIFNNKGEGLFELQDTLACTKPNQESLYIILEEIQNNKQIVKQALSAALDERHRDIFIKRRLLENPYTLEKLSLEYKISKERVRQIELQAFDKIKVYILKIRPNEDQT